METIEMKPKIPAWARQRVSPQHSRAEVQARHRQGRAEIGFPDGGKLEDWARAAHWPTPWFGFQKAFLEKLFESDETFALALRDGVVTIDIPIKEHSISEATLEKLDALYEAREDLGALGRRPTEWGSLVEKLREIRRLVEAGIEVKVEGTPTVLKTWQNFYSWAHGRYHALEDGADSWIGDDDS